MAVEAWLDNELPKLLPAFLPTQRWFGGKARKIQAVDVDDAVGLAGAPCRCALVVVNVRYADDGRERYVMLLAFVTGQAKLPIIGLLQQPGAALWAVEAAADACVAGALLRGFASRDEIPMLHGGTLRYADTSALAERGIADAAESGSITPVGTEQSNTSLRLGRALVFKLFRRSDAGENPELEVGRFLTTRTTFRAMPALQGSLTYVSARGESSTVGILQDWIESLSDGWTYVVARVRRRAGTDGGKLLEDLHTLGAVTADFHAAVATDTADPAFAPEPVTSADVQAWRLSLLERVARTCRLVEGSIHGWPGDARRLGEALLDLQDRMPVLVDDPALTPHRGFHKIRIHGDYHLGQVLKTPDGFAIIDLEGEPARPLAERRLKQCALKDVAGMIRSFDYAVEAARGKAPSATGNATYSRRLRASFLNGYMASAAAHFPAFLPHNRQGIDAWIDFFEIEKALYEVEYEINNRPAWVRIPLRGVLRLLRGRASRIQHPLGENAGYT